MPPSRKKRKVVNPHAQPGIARQHLDEQFSHLPPAIDDLKNGHVLQIYISLASNSRADTERHLKSHFFPEVQGSFGPCLNSDHIKTLVTQTLLKFKKLSNPKEFEAFSGICDKPFHLLINTAPDAADLAIPSTSGTFAVKDVPDEADPVNIEEISDPTSTPDKRLPVLSPGSSVVLTRSQSEALTPRKARMKKRLAFVSAASAEMKKRYLHTVSELRSKLKVPKRCFNQAIQRKINIIKRKDIEIASLRKKLEGNSLAIELKETRLELLKLKEAHKKLLKYHKGKRVSSSTVSTSKYELMQEKLKRKDEIIRDYEHEKLLLQEKIDDCERKDPKQSDLKLLIIPKD